LNAEMKINFINNIEQLSIADWQNVNNSACPFLRYDFFKALEKSQSVMNKVGKHII